MFSRSALTRCSNWRAHISFQTSGMKECADEEDLTLPVHADRTIVERSWVGSAVISDAEADRLLPTLSAMTLSCLLE